MHYICLQKSSERLKYMCVCVCVVRDFFEDSLSFDLVISPGQVCIRDSIIFWV